MNSGRDNNAPDYDPRDRGMDDVDIDNTEEAGIVGGVPRGATGAGPVNQPVGAVEGDFDDESAAREEYQRVERDDLRGVANTDAPDSFAGSGATAPPSSPHERAVLEAEQEEENPS